MKDRITDIISQAIRNCQGGACGVTLSEIEHEAHHAAGEILSLGFVDIRKMVDEQAEDEGLWFRAQTASEAYLQAALRNLHEEVERHIERVS